MSQSSSSKRMRTDDHEDTIFSPDLFTTDRIAALREQYQHTNRLPFHHVTIHNIFDEQLMDRVKQELLEIKYWPKNNDLYQFLQSKDLRSMKHKKQHHGDDDDDDGEESLYVKPHICKLRDALYSAQFRRFVCEITGWAPEELDSGTIDMSAACYRETDYLLCHDDQMEGRRIAYIVYFVPRDWSAEGDDGGTLDLFTVDENGQPDRIVKSLVPQWNSMTFFAVTPTSFHQVAEVLRAEEKLSDRVSISGWLHGKPIKRPPPYEEPPMQFDSLQSISTTATTTAAVAAKVDEANAGDSSSEPVFVIHDVVREWLNETYCNPETLQLVREAFAGQSSVELRDFLNNEKYDALLQEIKEHKKWEMVGPANRRHYERTEGEQGIVAECRRFLTSNEFADFLHSITQYEILKHNTQIRKFTRGCYTLVHNLPFDQHGLDAFLCVTDGEWDLDHGGSVIYMDENDELLSILPAGNTFSMVLRDEGVMRFTKYVNSRAPSARFDFCMVYEVPKPEYDSEDFDDGEYEGSEYDEDEASMREIDEDDVVEVDDE